MRLEAPELYAKHQDIKLYAWSPGDQQLPQTVHVPYWGRKSNPSIKVMTMVEKLLTTIESLKKQLAEQPTTAHGPDTSAEQPKNSDEERRNQARPMGGGGWMNKAVILMAYLFDGHVDEASSVAGDLLANNNVAYDLVWSTPITSI